MSLIKNKITLSAIDIGTSKVRVVISEFSQNENIKILSYSEESTEGYVIKGEIIDIPKISEIIDSAIKKAETKTSYLIDPSQLHVAITGNHITSSDTIGDAVINEKEKKITKEHLKDALEDSRKTLLSHDNVILDTITCKYIIDGEHIISDPLDSIASHLEMTVHTILASRNKVDTLREILKRQGLDKFTPSFSGLATALAVTTDDDLRTGTIVLNIGAGTTELMMFEDYVPKCTAVFTVGCEHIANDLATAFDLSFQQAKELLESEELTEANKMKKPTISIPGSFKNRDLSLHSINSVIELRISEIYDLVKKKLNEKKLLSRVKNGAIICGGITKIRSSIGIAKKQFEIPVKIGRPLGFDGNDEVIDDPGFITVLGLLKLAQKKYEEIDEKASDSIIRKLDKKLWPGMKKIILPFSSNNEN